MPRRTAYTKKTVKKSKKTDSYSWKKSTSENIRVSFNKIVVPTVIIVFSFAFLSGVYAYKSVTRPFASADSNTSNDTLTKEISTILLVSVNDLEGGDFNLNKVNLLLFDRKDNKVTDISLNIDQEIDVKGKYGLEPLSKVLSLGMSVSNNDVAKAIDLLESSIETTIPFTINHYMVVGESQYSNLHSILTTGNLLSAVNFGGTLLGNRELDVFNTNMTLNEVNSYRTFSNTLSSSQVQIIDSIDINNPKFNQAISDITFDSPVALERKSIAILNGTNTPGLASYGASFVKNIGGRVIATENTRTAYEKSVLIADDINSESVKELVEFFKIETVLLKTEASNIVENEVSRSDITIILGFDLSKSL